MFKFNTLSMKMKLGGGITLLLLTIIIFQTVYFPSHEKKLVIREVNSKIVSLTEIVTMGIGLGFGTGNLSMIADVFELAKKDENLKFICVLDPGNEKLAEFNPEELRLDYVALTGLKTPLVENGLIKFAMPVNYEGEDYGFVALGLSLDALTANIRKNYITSILIGIVTLLVGIVVATMIANMVIKPLIKVVELTNQIASGNLRVEDIEFDSHDELGQLVTSVNKMKQNLVQMIQGILISSEKLSTAAGDITDNSGRMVSIAKEQSVGASEVATSIEEITATLVETSQHAVTTSETAKDSSLVAQDGKSVVNDTIESMQKISDAVQSSSEIISELGKRSDDIGDIIQVINDIADQTNLLALNANIEAARAGDAGRGFAVVADEVRKLAERTTQSTNKIAQMVDIIQKSSGEAISSIQSGTALVESGLEKASLAEQALTKIVTGSEKAFELVAQIASATTQQSAAVEEISANVEGINKISGENLEASNEVIVLAEGMTDLTNDLKNLVKQFLV